MKKIIYLSLFMMLGSYVLALPKIMFIHGMFINRDTWKDWETYFKSKGWETMSPAWPGKDMIGMANRNESDHSFEANLTFTQVVNYYDSILGTMQEQPYLVGHGMGGLMVQHLLQRGKGRAAAIISSMPPHEGKTYPWKFIKAHWPAMSPFRNHRIAYLMPYHRFASYLCHAGNEDTKYWWRRYAVYESYNIWKALFCSESSIDYRKKTQALLIIGASKDLMAPQVMNKRNYKKYKMYNSSITEYRTMKGAAHLALLASNWKIIADEVYTFLAKY